MIAVGTLLVASGGVARSAPNPWVQSVNPARQFYVTPGGTGSGTAADPMGFSTAIQNALAGDIYWLRAGTYAGTFTLSQSGTADSPIVFRAAPGERATVQGKLVVNGSYTWIWGLEVTDPNAGGPTGPSGSIFVGAPGVHLINNVIHDTWEVGIGGWDNGPGHVYYGNIIFKVGQNADPSQCGYPIYTQNDFSQYGYKYVVQNMLLDTATDVGGPGYNFHAYTKSDVVTGYYLMQNILRNGRFLIGGYNVPADNEVVLQNYFYNHSVEFGYRRPSQVEFRNNYLGRSYLDAEWVWGQGETTYTQTHPNVFKGNEIYYPPSPNPHVLFRTSAYLASGRCEGCPAIQATDIFDGNTYSQPFSATLFANNTDLGTVDFATWRSGSAAAGNALDANSQELAGTPADRVAVLGNEYEAGRGHIAIYNWSKAATVNVDLSAIVASGAAFQVVDAKDPYGTPLASGTYSAPVTLPTNSAEFLALLVTSTSSGTSTNPPPATTPAPAPAPAPAPSSGPQISGVQASSITGSSALITWTTSSYATAQVEYGPSAAMGSTTATDGTMVQTHAVSLTGLASGTAYSYRVHSCDSDGACGVSSTYTFMTTGSADRTAPTVSITAPSPNQTVSGTIQLGAAASDNVAVAGVQFLVDGVASGSEITAAPYQTSLNTAALANGPHTVAARARDAAGNSSVATAVSITVANGATSAPVTVSFEAESAAIAAPMAVTSNNAASQRKYISSKTANSGTATYSVSLSSPGDYVIWCRVLAPTSTQASFFVSVDGGAEDVFDITPNSAWQWTRVNGRSGGTPLTLNPRKFTLAAGAHTIKVRARDAGAGLDRLVITNDPNFTPRSYSYAYSEAESGTLAAPMAASSSTAASGGKLVSSPTANTGSVTLAFTVPAAGNYIVWCRVLAPNSSQDSFFVSMDGGSEDIYDAAEGTWSSAWQWTKVNGRAGSAPLTLNPRVFALSAGKHTLKLRARDANTGLDTVLVTDDQTLTPAP